MKAKRIGPYTRLLNEIKDYCYKVKYRHKKIMWKYPKDNLDAHWKMVDLYHRVAAAEQLGYEVVLSACDEWLTVSYVKEVPEIPYEFRL